MIPPSKKRPSSIGYSQQRRHNATDDLRLAADTPQRQEADDLEIPKMMTLDDVTRMITTDALNSTSHRIPVERLTVGMTIMIDEGAWGKTAYVIDSIDTLHGGEEFVITYGNERGWSDVVSFEAGDMVEAS
jgi:hypothetical protein